ncbi:hypothetical protein BKH41_04220 [Helicobacter sp. 12S02232-10]|uniref:PEP-utilizing enzyme n=1 Tax=Helicobacter sp. 12S02232-10 TaxID=1476197 RepID=UPI000BA5738A|nr:PEP-utilizing enzyme [Helicobacter sp. 12S02232-10]PAF48840.1 hypothetical protein BKH41_04220 [Helicobacter sp. 12S02232-10]
MKKLSFKTKGENLAALSPIIKKAKILPLCLIQTETLDDNIEAIMTDISKLGETIIIRSSASNEDTLESSQAGAFLSIGNIPTSDKKSVLQALKAVKDSMGEGKNLILIQPMLKNPQMCGVAFSADKDNGAPYFCIDYDPSGNTNSVTAGIKSDLIHIVSHRSHKPKNHLIAKLKEAILELEEIFDNNYLDVEFAIVSEDIYILQVRPLIMKNKDIFFNSITDKALQKLSIKINSLKQKHPHILGNKTIFGIMPDWNPAEIIGLKPKRLAISLYKELVTDNIWAYQRDNYGYRNLRSHPLMYSFLGIPYIDVRLSFNSFIPKSLDDAIADKLVNYYLDSLSKKPHLHDKIEFEIVLSCYDLNLPKKLLKLKKYDFNQNELKRIEFSLLELTNNILDSRTGLYLKDLNRVNRLEERTQAVMQSSLCTIDKIYWLIEDCKRFGTLPFAGVARAAFIAMQILNSLVETGFFTTQEKDDFLLSLNTVSKELAFDVYKLSQKQIAKEKFIEKYGHLRAGTYNILSPSYKDAFEEYFSHNSLLPKPAQKTNFKLNFKKSKELDILLKQNGLYLNAEELFIFLKTVIEGRESVKFKFTKTLSIILDLISDLAKETSISKQDLAHLDIRSILSLQSSLYKTDIEEYFLNDIKRNKKEYETTAALKLPSIILNAQDVFYFENTKTEPNYITTKTIVAPTASENDKDLENKIVLIHSADPGYDFLFAKNIAGLITCYGGANSHMAIRCSEISLPAVIGVGEEKFSQYKKATKLRIDSLNRQVFIL